MAAPRKSSARAKTEARTAPEDSWPRDTDGNPMVKVQFAASELIPTQQYANVTVGPAVVTRFVPDGDDEHITAEVQRTAHIVEGVIAVERATVQETLQAQASK